MIDRKVVERLSKNQDYQELIKGLREDRKRLVRKLVELAPDEQLRSKFVELQGRIYAIDFILDSIYFEDTDGDNKLDAYDPYEL